MARRTAFVGACVGAVALVLGVVTGYALVGLGVCLGLSLALVNFRLISRATVKAAASAEENKRRPLVFNTLGRLGVISVIALGITFFVEQLGFGTLIGLAFFQFSMLGNVVVTMLRNPLMGDTTLGTALVDGEEDA